MFHVSHQGEVSHGAVPYGHLDDLGPALVARAPRGAAVGPVGGRGGGDVDALRLGGDLLDGAHEDVGHDRHAEERVDQAGEVQHGACPARPRHLLKKYIIQDLNLRYFFSV